MILDRRVAQALTFSIAIALGAIADSIPTWGEDAAPAGDATATDNSAAFSSEGSTAKEAKDIPPGVTGDEVAVEKPASARPAKSGGRRIDEADAFVAPPDWEFDGFVAGGKGQTYRSIFYLSDLIFLNVGTRHGLAPGDRIGIYKRGERIRDPQTGRFIGYEVRRAATSQITDKIDDATATARIMTTYEAVEIGDLVRREN